jgi:hypothetical protein
MLILSNGQFMFVLGMATDPGTTASPDPETTGSAECPVINESERINCIPDQSPTKVWLRIMDLVYI